MKKTKKRSKKCVKHVDVRIRNAKSAERNFALSAAKDASASIVNVNKIIIKNIK